MSKLNVANVRKALHYLKRNGVMNTIWASLERMEKSPEESYTYQYPAEEVLVKQRERKWHYEPLISIVVPTYRTPEAFLTKMVNSVLQQTYDHLELIITDATEDSSVETKLQGIIQKYKNGDKKRIVYLHLDKNVGISENTNAGIEKAAGEYIALLDHDDFLEPDALYWIADAIEKSFVFGKKAGMLYTDEDKCNQDETEYYEPHRKTDFNPDLLLSNNYICHFLVMEAGLMKRLKLRGAFNGAQDFDLVLRAAGELVFHEENDKKDGREPMEILHIPRVLYHWRCHRNSTAENPASKEYAYVAGQRAVQAFADARGWKAKAFPLKHMGFYGLHYEKDILEQRPELGAVCGRILKRGRIWGGGMKEDGSVLYAGLPARYSGYMHRAVLCQEVAAGDIRMLQVAKSQWPLFEKTVGVPYKEAKEGGWFDYTTLPEDADFEKLSLKLAKALHSEGKQILWDPSWSRKE